MDWNSILESIWGLIINHIPTISSITVILGVIKLLWDFFEKRRQKKLRFSEIFVEKDLKFRKNSLVGFCDSNSLNLCIMNEKPSNIELCEDYSEEVERLLKQEYYLEIWEHKERRDACIKAHNILAEDFLFNIIEEMRKDFRNSKNPLSEWDLNTKSDENYFIRETLLIDICYVIQSYYNEKEKSFDFNRLTVTSIKGKTDRWKLSVSQDFAYSNNEDMQDIKEIFRGVIIDYLTKLDFNKLKVDKKNAEKENTFFVKGINGIIKHVQLGNPLKGDYIFKEGAKRKIFPQILWIG